MKGLYLLIGILIAGLALGAAPGPYASPGGQPAWLPADFNGDKRADLAIGVPDEDIGDTGGWEGAVQVLYGGAARLSATGSQLWYQGNNGLVGATEFEDHFGTALAIGDFDHNGYFDLAVGAPGQKLNSLPSAGAVHVLYGSAAGLGAAGNEVWSQDSANVEDYVEMLDEFGKALAAGDFNHDGYDDLAIGVPGEGVDVPSMNEAGAVNILYGSASGLSATGDQLWYLNSPGIPGEPYHEDRLGTALATGDFDNDGRDDLAIGIPKYDLGGNGVGAALVIYGSSAGLSAAGSNIFGRSSVGTGSENFDEFGSVLTAGDFDNDGRDDLAIGIPGEFANFINAGAVGILYGAPFGLAAARSEIWYTGSPPHDGAKFGFALTACDFDGDGRADLAAGAPRYDGYGIAQIIYGSPTGLKDGVRITFIEDSPEAGDQFGAALAGGDFDDDGFCDLAIGVPGESIDTAPEGFEAGAVAVIYGSVHRLTPAHKQFWHQNSPGIGGVVEPSDHFGGALAAVPTVRRRVYLPLTLRNR